MMGTKLGRLVSIGALGLAHCDVGNIASTGPDDARGLGGASGTAPSGTNNGAGSGGTSDSTMIGSGTTTAGQTSESGTSTNTASNSTSSTTSASSGTTTTLPPLGGLRAFPEAEGFGAYASGGRGGPVIFVTNLNASGPGSFQAALDVQGPKYILFRVSGFINQYLTLGSSDVTIAGQTSPGGIIVRGIITDPDSVAQAHDNVIIRHLRLRPVNDDGDALRLTWLTNAIVDHLSLAHATDETMEISYSNHITVQNTLVAEALGGHPYNGALLNYGDPASGHDLSQISIVHNNWNRINERNPEVTRESPAQANGTMELEVSNNLMWDVQRPATIGFSQGQTGDAPTHIHLNWVGNLWFVRSNYPYGMIEPSEPGFADPLSQTYLSDNQINLYPDRHDYRLVYCCNDFSVSGASQTPTPSNALSTRLPFGEVNYIPSADLVAYMLHNVGAFPRDAMDRRLLHPLETGVIEPTPQNEIPGGTDDAFVVSAAPEPPLDTDNDGMPDVWEQAHGLNPEVDDHNGTELSVPFTGVDGYTNLDVYLNELANLLVSQQ